jgi:glycosyltransferase involved in cell wall biosynthesis
VRVYFFTPPPAQRIGGLDAAIDGLRAAIERQGIAVDTNPKSVGEHDSVAHFHGLWQPAHVRAGRECARSGTPFVISPHGMLEPWAWRHKWWKKWPYFHVVERSHLRRAACVLATADAEANRLRKMLGGQRVETLSLGMTGTARPDYAAARKELGWKDGERVLLYLSRLHVKKGLDLLLRALTAVSAPARTRLVIVGGGDAEYVRGLRNFADAHRAELPQIDWIGEVWGAGRWKYFQGADLFCLPTHSENFGLAVLEACQVGTPVLTTTTTPWATELTLERGWICEPTIEGLRTSLADCFNQPLQSEPERQALSEWAWARFSWDTLAGKYADLYRSLRPFASH